jgi:hypothetical protein
VLSERLGDAVTVIVDYHLRIFFLLLLWLRGRWNSIGDSRGVVGLLHFIAPWISEKPLAGYVAASWSSILMVEILVELIEDSDEILLGLFPRFLDSVNPILCCGKLGSGCSNSSRRARSLSSAPAAL